MRRLSINPNATRSMTDQVVAVAHLASPGAEVPGWADHAGPAAIQGSADGDAAVAGVPGLLPAARDATAGVIVIACLDDTGLDQVRATAHSPVIGIGQSALHMAALMGHRFSVVTTLAVSVPVIDANIAAYGFGPICARVRPTGLQVLAVDQASPQPWPALPTKSH